MYFIHGKEPKSCPVRGLTQATLGTTFDWGVMGRPSKWQNTADPAIHRFHIQPKSKNIRKKNPERFIKQNLNLPHSSNYSRITYIVFTIIYIVFTLY